MTNLICRPRRAGFAASLWTLGAIGALGSGACTSDPGDGDPCVAKPQVRGGSVEIGLGAGSSFTPIVESQDLSLILGAQGLMMFELSARTHELDVGLAPQTGVVVFGVFDASDKLVSLDLSCRVREFDSAGSAVTDTSARVLSNAYGTPLHPEFSAAVDGARLTLQVEVRDNAGHRAIDRRSVIAHLPTGF
jgi:hypothetical protein